MGKSKSKSVQFKQLFTRPSKTLKKISSFSNNKIARPILKTGKNLYKTIPKITKPVLLKSGRTIVKSTRPLRKLVKKEATNLARKVKQQYKDVGGIEGVAKSFAKSNYANEVVGQLKRSLQDSIYNPTKLAQSGNISRMMDVASELYGNPTVALLALAGL
jgi:hypothetical protein